jgi:hypothetical protein
MGIFGWDLPPGCRVSEIPGNRPEDEAWEKIYDNFWDKERLTKTHIGTQITDKEYEQMDRLYKSRLSEMIDSYIMAAIEYGMEIAQSEARINQEQNRYYETQHITDVLKESGITQEVIQKVTDILDGKYETP